MTDKWRMTRAEDKYTKHWKFPGQKSNYEIIKKAFKAKSKVVFTIAEAAKPRMRHAGATNNKPAILTALLTNSWLYNRYRKNDFFCLRRE